jgi:autotransporter-associated beta strand protein
VVNLVGTVTPGSITVNTTSNYTFTGAGSIGGAGGLTITNTGSLTNLTTDSYTGPTVLAGGTMVVSNIQVSGTPSGIGAASVAQNNLVFSGGTLSYVGPSGASTDHGITLTNLGGTLDITNGSSLTLNGELSGPGGLTLVDTGSLTLTAENNYAGLTTVSNGTLYLDNDAAASTNAIVLAGGTVTLEVGGSQQTYPNGLTITGNSTLISAGDNNNIISGPWNGPSGATLNVSITSGGVFTVNGSMTGYSGLVELGTSPGTFRFNSGGGNTSFGSPNTTFDLGASGILQARNAGTMNLGALEGGPGSFLKGQGSDAGLVTWVIGASPGNPSTTFAGMIENSAANEVAAITKVGAGTLYLANPNNSYTGSTIISNGVLSLTNIGNGDGSIGSSTNILLAGGALDVSSLTDIGSTLNLNSGQTLTGAGTITGSLAAYSGTVAPGLPLGSLNVTNTVTLGNSVVMNLNRNATPNCSSITAPSISQGGTLTVSNLGNALRAGDTFALFNGAISGGFGNLVLPILYHWNTANLGINGTIEVAGVLQPALSSVTLSSGLVTLNATNGPPNAQVIVVSSTNLALPLSQWTPLSTNMFDGNGNLSNITLNAVPGATQTFYTLEMPPQ